MAIDRRENDTYCQLEPSDYSTAGSLVPCELELFPDCVGVTLGFSKRKTVPKLLRGYQM